MGTENDFWDAVQRPAVADVAGTVFNLEREIANLKLIRPWQQRHSAKSLAHLPDLRVVLIAMDRSCHIPEHATPERLSLQALHGSVQIRAGARLFVLSEGDFLTLDRGVPVTLEALQECALLLTLAWKERAAV